jgi:hypothetical protein
MNKGAYNVTEFDRQAMSRELFDQLCAHGNIWLVVRTDGHGWEIVKPRSQEAIIEACATEALGRVYADEAMVERVARAMRAWVSPDHDIQGKWTVYEAGKPVGKFPNRDAAHEAKQKLNARAAIAAMKE